MGEWVLDQEMLGKPRIGMELQTWSEPRGNLADWAGRKSLEDDPQRIGQPSGKTDGKWLSANGSWCGENTA